MSRALNVDAAQQHVVDTCAKHKVTITAIETLVSGGTRVVLTTADAAATIERVYGKKVISGVVRRQPSRTLHATQ